MITKRGILKVFKTKEFLKNDKNWSDAKLDKVREAFVTPGD